MKLSNYKMFPETMKVKINYHSNVIQTLKIKTRLTYEQQLFPETVLTAHEAW